MKLLEWKYEGDCVRCTSHASNEQGYPMITRRGLRSRICRHITVRRHGPLPKSLVSRHLCGHEWCINPSHIELGTHRENIDDQIRANTYRPFLKGEQNRQCKLTEREVIEIRKSNKTQAALADQYGIGTSQISRIIRGIRWKHVQ
jgi:hypothetical protein